MKNLNVNAHRATLFAALLLLSGCTGEAVRRDISMSETGDADEHIVPTPGVRSTEPWKFGSVKGETIRTDHYRIFTTEKNPVIKNRMVTFAEYALANYRSAITPLPGPAEKLDTYLMDNRDQWQKVTQRIMGDQATELIRIQRGGFASRGIGVYYDLGLFDTLAIAAHEGWHQYTQRTFKDPLPVWLEEGIAVYMEGHRWNGGTPIFVPWGNIERFDQLRKAKSEGTLIGLDKLVGSRPQDFLGNAGGSLLNYYAQVWALTHFLHSAEGGKYEESFKALLNDAARGYLRMNLVKKQGERAADSALATRSGPTVFVAYFNEDLEAANAEYMDFVNRLVSPGTRDLVVAGKAPIDALKPGVGTPKP